MSRWKDLLSARAASVLEPSPAPVSEPVPPPVQTPAPPPPASPADPWLETRSWLRTVSLPAGPLVILRDRQGRPARALLDLELWRQAVLLEMQLIDEPDYRWPLSLEAVAGRRRTLLADVAQVQAALSRRSS